MLTCTALVKVLSTEIQWCTLVLQEVPDLPCISYIWKCLGMARVLGGAVVVALPSTDRSAAAVGSEPTL